MDTNTFVSDEDLKEKELSSKELMRLLPQGAGSRLDADTLRNKIPEDFAKKNGDLTFVFSVLNMLLAGYIEGDEISDPSAPAANKGRVYFRDNGAGKTQFVARFPSGAVQVIATEP